MASRAQPQTHHHHHSLSTLRQLLKDDGRTAQDVRMNEINKSPTPTSASASASADLFDGGRPKVELGEAESLDYEHRNALRRRNLSHAHPPPPRKATGMTRRCVCNLSQCASMNYMCKSERQTAEDGTDWEPGCFIEELDSSTPTADPSSGSAALSSPGTAAMTESNGRLTSARRGCIEMLSREKERLCRAESGDAVECCFNEDMCNYPKTFYPPLSPPLNQNHGPLSRLPYEPSAGIGRGGLNGSMDHQVWLRAAVIAVPVCGLLILIVLIYVARRLLNGDEDYKETASSSAQSMLSGGGRKSRRLYDGHTRPKPCELLLPAAPALDGFHAGVNGSHPQQQPCYWCSLRPNPTTLLLPTNSTQSPTLDPLHPYPAPTPWNLYLHNESQVESIGSGHAPAPTPAQPHPTLHLPERKRKFPFLNWKFGEAESGNCIGSMRPCHNV